MSDARDSARLDAEAVRMVTRLLRERGGADDEPLAATVVAALKGIGWRRPARPPDWQARGGTAGRMSDADRERVRADMAAATERQAAAAKARVSASRDGRRDPSGQDGGG